MTTRGKIILTILLLAVVGIGVYRWWDKIAPAGNAQQVSINPQEINKTLDATKAAAAIANKLLAGDKAVSLVDGSAIPPVTGVSDYDKPMKDGKLIVQFPINVWPGWAPIIVANNGLEPNEGSVFFQKYGFYVKLSIVDDPVKARDLFASGHSHVLWGTLDMIALFAPELVKDSRTVPVICQQVDWSGGGDGVVARGDIRNINDLRMHDGMRRKVVLAQNSPSHYLIMTLLIDAGIDPAQVDFKWAADAPAAAKIFVQDQSFDAFVGWSPDIYTVTDKVPGTRLVVTTGSANHLLADVWAVRNDFYRDHPDIVANLVRGIFDGMDMVRKNIPSAAQALSNAYNIPVEDCQGMIGKDGGVAEGDAHLTNYRENVNFFLDPMNPSNFETVWNRASTIYKSLGVIDASVPSAKVKAAAILAKISEEYREVRDLSQPSFKPGALFKTAEADSNEILTKSVIISFEPNKTVLNLDYDANIPAVMEEIGKLAGTFGNAYIVIEGNTDASRKGVVPADLVRQLSYDRADSVRKAILGKYKFDPNKFKVVGNGWENPASGCTDASNPEHNKKNRRVEVKVFPLEKE
ncbi:MAG: phosphate ABC transporter substrate-binding/OmpA family protein [Opitutaceae bacterium]|jgi:ABC-type nitrate/sulfonate/bicarbonate transport system substrate-binding protein/outer membrane protein OmpA-like peptidoglycan-associated protein